MKTHSYKIPIICLIALIISLPQPVKASPAEYEPIMIVELFRHGARSTMYNIFNETSITKQGLGELTPTGMRQHYNLGILVKNQYPTLFRGNNPTPFDYKVQTSYFNRTMQSAYSHLLGIYDIGSGPELITVLPEFIEPPYKKINEGQISLNQSLKNYALDQKVYPSKIFSIDWNNDNLFMSKTSIVCPYAALMGNMTSASHQKEMNDLVYPTGQQLLLSGFDPIQLYGKQSFENQEISQFYDYARSYLFTYGKLPEKISDFLYKQLELIYSIWFYETFDYPGMRRVFANGFYKTVKEEFSKKISDPDYEMKYVG